MIDAFQILWGGLYTMVLFVGAALGFLAVMLIYVTGNFAVAQEVVKGLNGARPGWVCRHERLILSISIAAWAWCIGTVYLAPPGEELVKLALLLTGVVQQVFVVIVCLEAEKQESDRVRRECLSSIR